jgi:ornithine cyclodeaminase/alanine dehydrogenase-like protein (mu-crystallin family)
MRSCAPVGPGGEARLSRRAWAGLNPVEPVSPSYRYTPGARAGQNAEPGQVRGVGRKARSARTMKHLRYLSATDVAAAMPALPERVDLAERTMRALGQDAELPPKIGVHPRQSGSLAHAMPALLRGEASDGSKDLIGVKWIAGFPENPSRGLPAYHALVLLSDSVTGEPQAVMEAGTITTARTAAISGTAIRHFLARGAGPAGGRSWRVAVLGAGAQARGHLPVVGYLLPGARVRVVDKDPARAAAFVADSAAYEGIGSIEPVAGVRAAVESADLVLSMVSFGPDRQTLDPTWLLPEALFVAVDYDMQAPAALARDALFVVDDRDQFLATRSGASFVGYPDPDATLGEVFRGEVPPRAGGRILVAHLGVGLADVVFGAAVLARAERLGVGRLLRL